MHVMSARGCCSSLQESPWPPAEGPPLLGTALPGLTQSGLGLGTSWELPTKQE